MAAVRRSCHGLRQIPKTAVATSIPSAPPKGIALFDLDGTLIAWDCQLLFRHFVLRKEPWRGIFLPLFLAFLPLAGLLGAAGMKRVFLSYLWRIDPEKLADYSREFAKTLMPAIRHTVLMLLAEKTASQLIDRRGKERFARQVQRETSRVLGAEVDDEEEEEEDAEAAPAKAKDGKGGTGAKKKKRKPASDLPVRAVHFSSFIVQ